MPKDAVQNTERYLRPGQTIQMEKVLRGSSFGGEQIRIVENGANLITISKTRHDLRKHLKSMDASGIRYALLSIATWQDWTTRESAPIINNEMANVIDGYRDRFGGLAAVSPTEDGADEELDRAVKDLGMKGLALTTNFHGLYPDEDVYRPLFKKASQLRVPVFFHAAGTPGCNKDFLKFDLDRSLGRQYDHLLATVRLLYSKYVQEFPNLKFVQGHYGGGFFLFQRRFLGGDSVNAEIVGKHYRRYIHSFYFDTAPCFWWGTKEFESAVALAGSDSLMLGSDYPLGEPKQRKTKMGVGIIQDANIPDKDKQKILGGNAARVFGIKE